MLTPLTKELTQYILGVIKNTSRFTSLKIEGAIINGTLIFLVDDTILYSINLKEKVDSNLVRGFESAQAYDTTETGALTFINNTLIQSENAYYKITNIYNNIFNQCTVVLFDDPIILDDPVFAKKVAIKATDGCEMYNAKTLSGVISIPVFSGLPLLSKGDKLGLSIYSAYDADQYILHYNVYKKKLNSNCHIYFKILNLNRQLRY